MQQIIEQTKKVLVVAAIACSVAFVSSYSSAETSVAAADAAATYKSKCASCHGANGSGQTAAGKAMKLKDLRSAEVQAMLPWKIAPWTVILPEPEEELLTAQPPIVR